MKSFNKPFATSGRSSHTIREGSTGAGVGTFALPMNPNSKANAVAPAPLKSRCASCRK